MKKALFGNTVLICTVTLLGAASAQTAGPKAPFTAILDGEAEASFGILSGTQNSGANGGHQRDFGMEQVAWMRFFFEAQADNGLTYGWYIRMMGTSSTISTNGFSNDREAIYFRSASWGTTEIGNGSSTAKVGFSFVNADWGPPTSESSYFGPDGKLEGAFLQNTDSRAFAIFNGFIKVGSDDAFAAGRASHIFYGTPEWNGLSLSLDYSPDGTSRNEEQFVTTTQAGIPSAPQTLSETNFQNIVSGNLEYRTVLGNVALAAGGQYAHGQSKNLFTATGSNQAFRDINALAIGGKANYAGFQFGLEGTWYGQSGVPKAIAGGTTGTVGKVVDTWGWSTGIEYFAGPWVIGSYYWYGRAPGTFQLGAPGTALTTSGGVSPGNGEFEMNNYGVGLGYTVAPGLKLFSELYYYDMYNTHVMAGNPNPNSGRHMTGQIYIFGTSIAW